MFLKFHVQHDEAAGLQIDEIKPGRESKLACVLFSNSVVDVRGSQTYRNMEMVREHISLTFDQGEVCFYAPEGTSVAY